MQCVAFQNVFCSTDRCVFSAFFQHNSRVDGRTNRHAFLWGCNSTLLRCSWTYMNIKTRPRWSTMRPQVTFSFFETFSFFHSPRRSFLIAPSSSSLLPPRPSFVLVLPSSSSLFLPRPALSKSFRIRNRPFFINFAGNITNRWTN